MRLLFPALVALLASVADGVASQRKRVCAAYAGEAAAKARGVREPMTLPRSKSGM
jgi:hypothetical protein